MENEKTTSDKDGRQDEMQKSKPENRSSGTSNRPVDHGKASDATSINPENEEPIIPSSPTLHPA